MFISGDLFSARQKVADHHLPQAVFLGLQVLQENQNPNKLITVPLNAHEFLNPEDAPKAPLGSTGVLSMIPEVRPEGKGGCCLLAHS